MRPAPDRGARGKRRTIAGQGPSRFGSTRHMALKAKDGLAMRLTYLGNRLALAAALMGAIAPVAGCRRLPYIDQSKSVPHNPLGLSAEEDGEVKQAQFLQKPPLPMPKIAD